MQESATVRAHAEPARAEVRCRTCNFKVFDGLMLRTTIIRVLPRGAEGKCKRCKAWTPVPVTYSG